MKKNLIDIVIFELTNDTPLSVYPAVATIIMLAEQEQKTLQEQIQERILNLTDAATTSFMHLLGVWDDNKRVMEYNTHNIGELVTYGNDMGWDVELNIEVGHDYHLVGEYVKKNGVDTYRIYGIHNEFDEWADLLRIHTLVGEIAKDNAKQFLLKQIEDIYNV